MQAERAGSEEQYSHGNTRKHTEVKLQCPDETARWRDQNKLVTVLGIRQQATCVGRNTAKEQHAHGPQGPDPLRDIAPAPVARSDRYVGGTPGRRARGRTRVPRPVGYREHARPRLLLRPDRDPDLRGRRHHVDPARRGRRRAAHPPPRTWSRTRSPRSTTPATAARSSGWAWAATTTTTQFQIPRETPRAALPRGRGADQGAVDAAAR